MSSFVRQFHTDEKGATATIIALSLFALLAAAAAAIDLGYANATRTELQVTASAAALAGVQNINNGDGDLTPDDDAWRDAAIEYVYRNMAASTHGNVLSSTCGTYEPASGTVIGSADCPDIEIGDWDEVSRTFTEHTQPGAVELDAVRVFAHRNQANDNPLGLFIAPVVGLAEQDINVSAVAWSSASPLDCFQRGIMSNGQVDMDSTNDFLNAICVYGEEGVKIQSDNCFQGPDTSCAGQGTQDPGVQVKTPPPPNWDEQGSSNDGFEDAKREGDEDLLLAGIVDQFIDAADVGFDALGDWEEAGFEYETFAKPCTPTCTVETSMPSGSLTPGTIYDISGTADIPKGHWRDVAIRADIIKLQSDSSLRNAVLMAETEIVVDGDVWNAVLASRNLLKFGSNVCIGHNGDGDTPCSGSVPACEGFSVGAYSLGKFTIQSNTEMRNAQLITGYEAEEFDLQSNNTYENVTIQAMGNVNLGSDNSFAGCPQGSEGGPDGGLSGLFVRLVD